MEENQVKRTCSLAYIIGYENMASVIEVVGMYVVVSTSAIQSHKSIVNIPN